MSCSVHCGFPGCNDVCEVDRYCEVCKGGFCELHFRLQSVVCVECDLAVAEDGHINVVDDNVVVSEERDLVAAEDGHMNVAETENDDLVVSEENDLVAAEDERKYHTAVEEVLTEIHAWLINRLETSLKLMRETDSFVSQGLNIRIINGSMEGTLTVRCAGFGLSKKELYKPTSSHSSVESNPVTCPLEISSVSRIATLMSVVYEGFRYDFLTDGKVGSTDVSTKANELNVILRLNAGCRLENSFVQEVCRKIARVPCRFPLYFGEDEPTRNRELLMNVRLAVNRAHQLRSQRPLKPVETVLDPKKVDDEDWDLVVNVARRIFKTVTDLEEQKKNKGLLDKSAQGKLGGLEKTFRYLSEELLQKRKRASEEVKCITCLATCPRCRSCRPRKK